MGHVLLSRPQASGKSVMGGFVHLILVSFIHCPSNPNQPSVLTHYCLMHRLPSLSTIVHLNHRNPVPIDEIHLMCMSPREDKLSTQPKWPPRLDITSIISIIIIENVAPRVDLHTLMFLQPSLHFGES